MGMKHMTMRGDIGTYRYRDPITEKIAENPRTIGVVESFGVVSNRFPVMATNGTSRGRPRHNRLDGHMVTDVDISYQLMGPPDTAIEAMHNRAPTQIINHMGPTTFVIVRVRLNGIIKATTTMDGVKRTESKAIQEITKAREVGRGRFQLSANVTNEVTSRRKGTDVAIDAANYRHLLTILATNSSQVFNKAIPPLFRIFGFTSVVRGMGRNGKEIDIPTGYPNNNITKARHDNRNMLSADDFSYC